MIKKFFKWLMVIILVLTMMVGLVMFKFYYDMKQTINGAYQPIERIASGISENKVDLMKKDPFSVLILGIDTGEYGRKDTGRSDTILVATVNPRKKTTTFMSIPRDTYTEIVGNNKQDKINHAYAFGGTAMSVATVEKFLNVPINYYISVDMGGFEKIIDLLGGVYVNNDMKFEQEGNTFNIGRISLTGKQVLPYVRMRYDDPTGDYGRQKRQRFVLKGITEKVTSLHGLVSVEKILATAGDALQTNLNFKEISEIFFQYRPAIKHVDSEQIQGTELKLNNISYQQIADEKLQHAQHKLREQLELPTVDH